MVYLQTINNYNLHQLLKNRLRVRTHVQFSKRVLGCSFTNTNKMIGLVGVRPLLSQTITRVIRYIESIKSQMVSIVHTAYGNESKCFYLPANGTRGRFAKIINFGKYLLEIKNIGHRKALP